MNDNSSNSNSTIVEENTSNYSNSFSSITLLKRSGFNVLYKAQRYGKWYILKGLGDEYKQSELHRRLLQKEFDLGIKLEHSNILHTIGIEDIENIGTCIVEEFIDGITLDEFLKTNPTKSTRRKIVFQLLDALQYIHELQIVHRDLKPSNLLITRNGNNLKIIDFGLSDSDFHAILKQPAGSPKYMAPECFDNTPLDCRADIYSFGVLLHKILPNSYRSIAKRCTKPNREQRYNSIREIKQRIARHDALLRSLPIVFLIAVCISSWMAYWLSPRQASKEDVTRIAEELIQNERNNLLELSVQKSNSDTIYLEPSEENIRKTAEKLIRDEREQMIDIANQAIGNEISKIYAKVHNEQPDYNSAYQLLSDFYQKTGKLRDSIGKQFTDQSKKYEFINIFTLKVSEYSIAYVDSIGKIYHIENQQTTSMN